MIYLDYTANTPADPAVLNAFIAAEQRYIANPNSTHIAGQQARAEMDRVTSSIAQHLGVQPAEIIYTSGASEANNLAVKGIAQAARHIGKHIISTELEHSSVGASLSVLQQQGYEIDLLRIGRDGRVDLDQLRELLRDDTILVAVCAVLQAAVDPADGGAAGPGVLEDILVDHPFPQVHGYLDPLAHGLELGDGA